MWRPPTPITGSTGLSTGGAPLATSHFRRAGALQNARVGGRVENRRAGGAPKIKLSNRRGGEAAHAPYGRVGAWRNKQSDPTYTSDWVLSNGGAAWISRGDWSEHMPRGSVATLVGGTQTLFAIYSSGERCAGKPPAPISDWRRGE